MKNGTRTGSKKATLAARARSWEAVLNKTDDTNLGEVLLADDLRIDLLQCLPHMSDAAVQRVVPIIIQAGDIATRIYTDVPQHPVNEDVKRFSKEMSKLAHWQWDYEYGLRDRGWSRSKIRWHMREVNSLVRGILNVESDEAWRRITVLRRLARAFDGHDEASPAALN